MSTFSPSTVLRRVSQAAAVTTVAALALGIAPSAGAATTAKAPNLVSNGTFNTDLTGWATNKSHIRLKQSTQARSGSHSVVLSTTKEGSDVILNDSPNTVTSTKAKTAYDVSAWVKAAEPGLTGHLRVREVNRKGEVAVFGQSFYLRDDSWTKISFSFSTKAAGDSLDLSVVGWKFAKQQRLYVDNVMMSVAASTTSPAPTTDPVDRIATMSNGVGVSRRGIPASGAVVGAAVGSNADPAAFEESTGQRLGVRRTYWGADGVDRAVGNARRDLAAGRLPWISFKLPHSWSDMADGAGDAWAKDLAVKLSKLNGPVWVAFYHEPEMHGDVKEWKRMQERLGPIVRSNASNVAFTVILTGYHQMFGDPQFSLDRIFPDTKVDVAGFDIYNFYGCKNNSGGVFTKPSDLRRWYFEPIGQWAASKGMAWGLAETGFNNAAAEAFPDLMRTTYDSMVENGGVAFSYFNSPLHSSSSWDITTPAKLKQFSSLVKGAPTYPKFV